MLEFTAKKLYFETGHCARKENSMKRQYIKPYRRGISFLMVTACVSALISGCGQQTGESGEVMDERIPVQVQAPEAGTLTLKNEFVGTISPEESVYVMPTVSAEVLSTEVSVGDTVSAGDTLCQLDDKPAELQLASAKAQYNSAAAGVDSAQIGYEAAQAQYNSAQAQYESTMAQLDAQLGGQKNLQLYQLQAQVDMVNGSIDHLNNQMADLDENRKDAQEAKDELRDDRNDARDYLEDAERNYGAALTAVTRLEPQDYNELQALIGSYPGGEDAYKHDLQQAKEALNAAEANYKQASTAVSQLESAYEQAKSGIEQIESSQEQLGNTITDTYRQLEQAEVTRNITAEQIYEDTQKVVDANRNAAAVGLESAAVGIDSAAAGVNSAQVGVQGAQVGIDSAKYQLEMYTLKAPIDGVIESVNVKEHDFAAPGSPAYVISNKDTMMVTFYVSEGIRNTLSVGQKVEVDRNGKKYGASITEIGSMVDQTTGLFAIKACVSAPDESLLTGCSVKVIADTYSQDNALLIPYDAVYYDGGQPYVYVSVDDVAKRKDVETGIFDEVTMTILSGLSAEDKLIVSWSANLRDGAFVTVQDTKGGGAAESSGEVQESEGTENTGDVQGGEATESTGNTQDGEDAENAGETQDGGEIEDSKETEGTKEAQDAQATQDAGEDSALAGEE